MTQLRVAEPLADHGCELGPGPGRRVQHVADRAVDGVELVGRHLEVLEPRGRPRVVARGPGGHEPPQVVRREEMERAAHGPGLDEAPVGDRVLDVAPADPVDAGGELKLRVARDLGLDPDEIAGDVDERVAPDARSKVLPLQPKPRHLEPGRDRRAGSGSFGNGDQPADSASSVTRSTA